MYKVTFSFSFYLHHSLSESPEDQTASGRPLIAGIIGWSRPENFLTSSLRDVHLTQVASLAATKSRAAQSKLIHFLH